MRHNKLTHSLVWLLITVHLVTICGCTTTNRLTLPGNETPVGSNYKITTVILKDGEVIEFDRDGGLYVEKIKGGTSYRAIVGTTSNKKIEIDPENTLEVKFEQQESNGSGSFFLGLLLGLPVGAGLLVLILTGFNWGGS